jgi:hypothetical protein
MALFGTAYFQLLHKFKQKFCQTASFCSSLSAQNTLKAANKQKLLFTSLSDKLLFQQAAAVPNRAYVPSRGCMAHFVSARTHRLTVGVAA